MKDFAESLRDARVASRYPRKCDFVAKAGIIDRTYNRYESGTHLPDIEILETIIHNCCLSDETARRLRDAHAVSAAKKLGLELQTLPASLNVSELAERIQREVEYELKRAHLQVTTRTRQVCVRRIEMLLKGALRIS